MAEIYNIRDIKIAITKVLYTPAGNRFRLHNSFVATSIQDSRFIFIIYSGKQRFIEIGFDDASVYKILRFFFKNKTINNIIMNITEFSNVIRTK
jgi:hypothetical protein